MADTPTSGAESTRQTYSRVSIRRRILNMLPDPLAGRIHSWLSRGFWGRYGRLCDRIEELDEDRRQAFWSREAIVTRLNQFEAVAEARWQHQIDFENRMLAVSAHAAHMPVLESRIDELTWGREALVERANYIDARDQYRASGFDERFIAIDERIRALNDKLIEIAGNGIVDMNERDAAQLDALALNRRLAVLEDQIERLLEVVGKVSEEGEDAAPLVAFPRQSQKEAS